MRPLGKVDQVIEHREEASIDNISNTCVLQQSKDIDYHSVQQLVDALLLVFGMPEFKMLMNTQYTSCSSQHVPIDFKLLWDRSANHIEVQEYNEHSEATSKVASQWKFAFLEIAKERLH
jgi:hypothetical protein